MISNNRGEENSGITHPLCAGDPTGVVHELEERANAVTRDA